MKHDTCRRLCALIEQHAPQLARAVDVLDEHEAADVFTSIGSAAALVLSEVWQKRVDQGPQT